MCTPQLPCRRWPLPRQWTPPSMLALTMASSFLRPSVCPSIQSVLGSQSSSEDSPSTCLPPGGHKDA